MSAENVEFVRNLYARIDRGNAEAWDLLPRDFVIDLSRRLHRPRDPSWNLWTFRDGEPVRWTYFGEDRAEALEAAGLRE
jgi:ketosteroid isomerase-like protein